MARYSKRHREATRFGTADRLGAAASSTTRQATRRSTCLLCSRPPSFVSIWNPARFTAGHRSISYSLCSKHFRRRNRLVLEFESKLTQRLVEQN